MDESYICFTYGKNWNLFHMWAQLKSIPQMNNNEIYVSCLVYQPMLSPKWSLPMWISSSLCHVPMCLHCPFFLATCWCHLSIYIFHAFVTHYGRLQLHQIVMPSWPQLDVICQFMFVLPSNSYDLNFTLGNLFFNIVMLLYLTKIFY